MIAGEEAALERGKLEFIEKEKQLQVLQHSFNDLVQQLRNKEGEKNLPASVLIFYRKNKPAGFFIQGFRSE
jgi:chromosome segregation protein